MPKRRMGTIPSHVRLTQATSDRIDAYQQQHQIPSFSAAVETLVRIGLDQSPGEILAPMIASTVRQELGRGMERLIKLQIYTAIEAGIGQRLAGAAVRDIGRVKKDEPERYDRIRQLATKETRMRIARGSIGEVIADLYQEFAPDDDGDHQG